MRVLLDENLPRGLKQDLLAHDVSTVTEIGWSGLGDAELLRRAGERFDVPITADRSMEFQQNVAAAALGIVVVGAPNTRLVTIRSLAPAILRAVDSVRPGYAVLVSSTSSTERRRL